MSGRREPGEVDLREVLDAIPTPLFVLEGSHRIVDRNAAAARLRAEDPPEVSLGKLCGDVLCCTHALASLQGCGSSDFCGACLLRQSVELACAGRRVVRRKTEMCLRTGDTVREVHFLITAAPFAGGDGRGALLILEDVSELMQLKELIPICAQCKKIRSDEEYWERLESYFHREVGANFTHGLCPGCLRRHEADWNAGPGQG